MSSLRDLYSLHQGKLSAKWEGNLREYDRLLLPYKNLPVRTFEIGVQNGGSLDIFNQYFAKGKKFIGCDINLDCRKLVYDDPRISLILGDANTDETQAEILSQSDIFDLIIDDGSHMSSDIVTSFARYFPHLNEGGMYIVEDLHCSYWQEFGGGLYHPFSSITFFKYLVDIVNHDHWNFNKSREKILSAFGNHFDVVFSEEMLSKIKSVEFVNSMCVIHKSDSSLVRLGDQIFSGKSDLVVNKALFTPPSQQYNKWSILELSPAESFEKLSKNIAERDTQISELSAQIVERDDQITEWIAATADRDAQIVERDDQITELSAQIVERDDQITELSAQIVERDDQITELITQASEKEAKISIVMNSICWRLTKLFGLVKKIMKHKFMYVKQWFDKWLNGKYLLRLTAFLRGEINSVRENTLRDIRFHIDKPNSIFKIAKGSLLVTGWSVDLNTHSTAKVRIRIGKRVYQPCIVPRAEVSIAFASVCKLPKDVGFLCVPSVPMGLYHMGIDIQDSDNSWIPVRRTLLLNVIGKFALQKIFLSMVQNDCKKEYTFKQTVAVAYVVRGADKDWLLSCKRFIDSYKHFPSGVNHSLYVIFKGFADIGDVEKAKALTSSVPHKSVFLGDDSFDIGAYIEWTNMINEQYICVFNTASEILTSDWLLSFANNLMMPNVGLVGATGSYESLNALCSDFPKFPNVHVRSTAFMIEREYFCKITKRFKIECKEDAWGFESGPSSMSRQVLSDGKKVLLVGRNGKGYSPSFWPTSGIFRQGKQENLLVADNQTKSFNDLPREMKKFTIFHTWGSEYV